METVSSVTNHCVISTLLLANVDPDPITHPNLQIECEEKLDELFLEASQLLNVEPLINSVVVKSSDKQQVDIEPLDNPLTCDS